MRSAGSEIESETPSSAHRERRRERRRPHGFALSDWEGTPGKWNGGIVIVRTFRLLRSVVC